MAAGGGAQTLQEQPPRRHPDPQRPSPSRPRHEGEGRPAAIRQRLHDDRLFGEVLALKRWLAHRGGR